MSALLYAARRMAGTLPGRFWQLGRAGAQSLLVLNYLLMDILLATTRIIRQCGGNLLMFCPRVDDANGADQVGPAPSRALEAGQEMIDLALAYRDRNAISRYGETLRQARDYIAMYIART